MNIASKPTVAVIIPFYNGSKWIERAILSVSQQSIPPDEFIIVNDGSSDEEKARLYELSQRYSFKVVDKANGGQGSARNTGVSVTSSQYISFLDQDDFYLSYHIEALVNALPENDPYFGFVYADLCMADEAGNITNSAFIKTEAPGVHPKRGSVSNLLRHDMFILPSASLIKRVAFEKVGGFDEQFMGYEDDDLFLRMFRAGFTNYFLDKAVTVWCIHAASTSWSIKMSRSRLKYIEKISAAFPDDTDRQFFFFRDCLMPRFEPTLMAAVVEAAKIHSQDREELCEILKKYRDMVLKNKSVRLWKKCRACCKTFILTLPSVTLVNLFRLVYKTLLVWRWV